MHIKTRNRVKHMRRVSSGIDISPSFPFNSACLTRYNGPRVNARYFAKTRREYPFSNHATRY